MEANFLETRFDHEKNRCIRVIKKPEILLQYEVDLEERKIKNALLEDKLVNYMNKNFDLELKIKFLEAKIDEFMAKDEKNRMVSTPKIMAE